MKTLHVLRGSRAEIQAGVARLLSSGLQVHSSCWAEEDFHVYTDLVVEPAVGTLVFISAWPVAS